MLKRFCAFLIGLIWMIQGSAALAGPLEDYYEAQKLYIFAAACRAAYNDHLGRVALDALSDNGWQVQQYKKVGEKADARLLLTYKTMKETGQTVYILAATGTETMKDVVTDLMVDRIYFSGHTPDEMAENAAKKEVPPGAPMIHRGFYYYVQTALTIADPDEKTPGKGLLFHAVSGNPDRKIYLVGHSLGGAAATVSAAALLNFGASPGQLEVVTFGAPAVGNEAFRNLYGPQLNLKRYVVRGDIVTGILQGFGGYVQTGDAITWTSPDNYDYDPHDMVLYLDHAIKNFYLKRRLAIDAGVLTDRNRVPPANPGQPFVYVSPVLKIIPEELREDYYFMEEALYGEYRDLFPAHIFAREDAGKDRIPQYIKAAAVEGCQWLVVPEFEAQRLKNDRNSYSIVFRQTVYRVKDGAVVSMETYSCGTQKITPVEAAIHNAIEMSSQNAPWLKTE